MGKWPRREGPFTILLYKGRPVLLNMARGGHRDRRARIRENDKVFEEAHKKIPSCDVVAG